MRGVLLALVLAACNGGDDDGVPTPTGTTCPQPDPQTITYDNFGMEFMSQYCTMCHDSALPRAQRNGAPLFHDLETLEGVFKVSNHIDEQAGFGPNAENTFMPPESCPSTPGGPLDRDCPRPTADERRRLAEWLACEQDRPHTF